jgi:diphthamide biosynthesis protein 2
VIHHTHIHWVPCSKYFLTLDAIYDRLASSGYTNINKHPIPDTHDIITPSTPSHATLLPPTTLIPDTTLLLIADPKDSTTTLLTYHHLCPEIYTFSPQTSSLTLSSPATNFALRRRYVAVNKARDAGTIGIIVGTLGKGGYLDLITLLRKMVLERGKKPYLLSLGKLNPAKVANFSECDVFCIIACPESTVVDSRVSHRSYCG